MASFIPVTAFSDPALDVYARQTENQLVNRADPENGLFITESPLVIQRALDAGYEPCSALMEDGPRAPAARALPDLFPADLPVYVAPPEVLCRITGFHLTRGLLCAMRRRALPAPEALCAGARRIAVLEDVMNPTNLGAIFRSAAALNMDAVLLTPGCTDPLYRRAARVSMGNVFAVPFAWLPEAGWMAMLRQLGFKTVAMALRDDTLPLWDLRLAAEEKLAIVLGTEGDGLPERTIAACDYTVRIPMTHGVDSLNVAAASAVAFYQLALRQP